MKGGNGVREANGITQFAEGEPKRREVFIQNDEAENHPRMDSALGVLLDGCAVKEKAEASKNLLKVESPSAPLVRGRSVRRNLFTPLE